MTSPVAVAVAWRQRPITLSVALFVLILHWTRTTGRHCASPAIGARHRPSQPPDVRRTGEAAAPLPGDRVPRSPSWNVWVSGSLFTRPEFNEPRFTHPKE